MHINEIYSAATALAAISAGSVTVRRNERVYGVGSNPSGGRYIAVHYGRGSDEIYERAVDAGRVPTDGGVGHRWAQLTAALGCSPWEASDEQIISAWSATVDTTLIARYVRAA